MKRIFIIIFLITVCINPVLTAKNLAIMDFKASNVKEAEADLLRNTLETALVNNTGIKIIERAKMNKILKEQEIQLSGITKEEDAVKIGKILNVHFLMFGDISKVEGKKYFTVKAVSVENAKTLSMLQLSADSIEDLIQEIKVKAPKQFKGLMTLDLFYPVFDEADKGITVIKTIKDNLPVYTVNVKAAEKEEGFYFDTSRIDPTVFSSLRIKLSGAYPDNIGVYFYTEEEKESGYVELPAMIASEPGLYLIDIMDFNLNKKEKWIGLGFYFADKTKNSSFTIDELCIIP